MKKSKSFSVAMLLVLTLAGCGKGSHEIKPPETTDVQASQETGYTKSGSAEPETQAPEIQEPETVKAHYPEVVKTTVGMHEFDDQGLLLEMYHEDVMLSSESKVDFPLLDQALRAQNTEINTYCESVRDSMILDARQTRIDMGESRIYFVCKTDSYVKRADDKVLSILQVNDEYTGGMHGYASYSGVNLDVQTGRKLAITDVLKDAGELPQVLTKLLQHDYQQELFGDPTEQLMGYNPEDYQWVLDADGVTFFFAPYELAPYSSGVLEARLDLATYQDMFRSPYDQAASIAAEELNPSETITRDLDGDGSPDLISITGYPDAYDTISELNIDINGRHFQQEIYSFAIRPTLIRLDGGISYLYLETAEDNDFRMLYVFQLDKNGVKKTVGNVYESRASIWVTEDESAYLYVLTNPEKFRLSSGGALLSTYTKWRHYTLGADGMPQPLDPYYFIPESTDIELTAKAELRTDLIDPTTGEPAVGTESRVIIPVGEKLSFVATDDETFVDMRMTDGRIVRIYAVKGIWQGTVGGYPSDQVFDGEMFAG